MTFEEVVNQAIAMLQRRGRVTYRLLKRQFSLDDEALEDLKEEIIYGQHLAVDEDSRVLVWAGESGTSPVSTPMPAQPAPQSATRDVHPLQAERPLSDPHTPDAERRQLTVMFCDLVGSTPLSEQLDPEDLLEVIRAYHQTCAEVVQRFDGHIAQLLGDALLVYFGWPRAHEDDAQRAVRTGLGMLEAMGTLNARLEQNKGIRLAIRVGIHTGLVVVGEMGGGGHRERLALGDTPNIAARIQGLAAPDTVVISAATFRLVQGYVVCQNLGLHPLKGVAQPLTVYHALRVSGAQSRLEVTIPMGLTQLVGRERELALLQDRFAEAQTGHGQAVFVYGEAGIGKSRLLLEFRRQVEAAGTRWLEGRCVSYGRGMAYLPILDVVRNLAGIQEADDVAMVVTKLETAVRAVGADLNWTVPFLRTMLSLDPGDPEVVAMVPIQRRGRIAEALRALVVGLSQHQPVIVFVEDLHWIDHHSDEVIRLVLGGIAVAPVLVLLTHRPGYTPPLGEQTYTSRITLHELPEAQTRVMVERVLQSAKVPAAVVELIARRAEGNPLFIEELCTALLEDRTLQRANGSYRLTRPLSEEAIPDTIQGVIMARIDRLPDVAKAALQVAAVVGREFTARLVERVSAMGPETARALGELRAVELIYEKTTFPELAYMFKHALTHDVAYESLLRQRRRALHRRVGEVIEELYAERLPEFFEVLAWHYVRGETWPKAVDYLLKAADQARARYAYPEAIHHCTAVIDILERHGGATNAMLRACEGLGDLQSLQGHVEPANQAYDRALEIADVPATRQRLTRKRHRPGVAVRNGTKIAYYVHGTSDPTFLLMSPFIYGLRMFQPLVELLCQECRVITVDPRGAGGSDPLPGTFFYLLRDHVEDARAVIEATGNRPVVFIGISAAGALAVNFALTYPDLVEKLILLGTRPTRPPPNPERTQRIAALVQAGDYEQLLRLFWPRVLTEPGSGNLIENVIQTTLESSSEIIRNFFMSGDDPKRDLLPLLPRLQVPTLVLHGEADQLVPVEVGRDLADHISGAQFYALKGRGHGLLSTATAELAQVIREFIQTGRVT